MELARPWIATSEDPITGIYQTMQRFFNPMFDRFGSYASASANAKQYMGIYLRATRSLTQDFVLCVPVDRPE